MSSTTTAGGFAPYLVFIAIIILVMFRVVRRTYANYRGTEFSFSRTVVFAVVYVVIGAMFSALSFLGGVSPLVAVPEIVLAVMAAFWSYRYTDKRISFWKPPEGQLFFRGGIVIYLIYIVGLIARLSIDVIFVGSSMFSASSGAQLSGTALYGSMATDLLLIFGVGLLIGRNVRVARRFLKIQRGEETVPNTPPQRVGGLPGA